MTLSYPWTFDLERERASFLVELRRKRRRIDPMLISLGVTIWTFLQSGQRGLATAALILLLVRVALLYAPPFWLDFLAPASTKTDWPTQSLTLGEEGIELKRRDKSILTPWENLSELLETETSYYLCDNETSTIGIPKSAFDNDEARTEFINRIKEGLQAAREAKAKVSSTLPLGR